ncbi:hypothetical protein IEQ_04899 [Bacillus cereus BAG6X1-2]|nr:hypothetical protein IEQ_04899 [Bacillus cereus BAG6X1-2]
MVKLGSVVEFNKIKKFTHIKPLGQGGTGDTHLFKDENTDMLFAIKKYVPKGNNNIDENYLVKLLERILIILNLNI